MNLCIDASNLSVRGGGATHLRGILNGCDPRSYGFDKVTVFGSKLLLDSLPVDPWLVRGHHAWLDRGLAWRTLWQCSKLNAALKEHQCDLLFAPCGNYLGPFRPFVAMSHNLLLFEARERARFGVSTMRFKLDCLAHVQRKCFHEADGLILISQYAKMCIRQSLQRNLQDVPVIYHGVGERFVHPPKPQRPITDYSTSAPFKLLYVSTVSVYKHQDMLVKAFMRLVEEGLPVHLDLVGGAYSPSLQKLTKLLQQIPGAIDHVTYHGSVPIDKIQEFYRAADAFVFASTCENMPNILVEAMQAGLPICSSHRGPMPEILGECGMYFSPESIDGTVKALRQLVTNEIERTRLASAAFDAARRFTWEHCAHDTFGYLHSVGSARADSASPAVSAARAA